jgi:hypothetical protein
MITMKLWTNKNDLIELNYDDPPVAAAIWATVISTGRYPGTGVALSRAYYWGPTRNRGEGPDKAWAA